MRSPNHAFQILLSLCLAVTVGLAAEGSSVKFPSPDGHFALRISTIGEGDEATQKAELIEKESGKPMIDLGAVYRNHVSNTVLVWSADSKWVAYGTRDNREGETSVYFWNGSAFDKINLPDDLPGPDIKFRRKDQNGGVKNYGGAVKPLRWLKSGSLEVSSDLTMMSRESGTTYTGVELITIAFDGKRHASVQKIGKTKTEISE